MGKTYNKFRSNVRAAMRAQFEMYNDPLILDDSEDERVVVQPPVVEVLVAPIYVPNQVSEIMQFFLN
jgi:hypothetical protein